MDLRSTPLSYIFNALFRDTPLGHVYRMQPNSQIAKLARYFYINIIFFFFGTGSHWSDVCQNDPNRARAIYLKATAFTIQKVEKGSFRSLEHQPWFQPFENKPPQLQSINFQSESVERRLSVSICTQKAFQKHGTVVESHL